MTPLVNETKIKVNQKVRLPDGSTGKVIDYDGKTKQYGVCCETNRLWELRWFPGGMLKVTK